MTEKKNRRGWRPWAAGLLAVLQLALCVMPLQAAKPGEPIVALGADLTGEQRAVVLQHRSGFRALHSDYGYQ